MPASRRVSPTERVRAQIDELFGSGRELGHVLEEVARLGVALLFQVAFEAEITEFLGRDRYSRGERVHEACETATRRSRSRHPRARSRLSGRSSAATTNPSSPGCSGLG